MSDPSTVYGTRLKGWWFQNTTGSLGVSTWTSEAGPNLTQSSSGLRPTTSTTPAPKKSLVFDQSIPEGLAGSITLSGSPTAYQVAFAVNMIATPGGAVLCSLQSSGSIVYGCRVNNDGIGLSIIVENNTGFLRTDYLTAGWHTCIVDVDTSGNATVYIDGIVVSGGVSVPTSTGFVDIATIDNVVAGDNGDYLGPASGTAEICSPCFAVDTSNFTSTDRAAIHGVLNSYITLFANGTRASSAWGVRAPTIAEAVSGTRASSIYTARTPAIAKAVSGPRASSAWGGRVPTIAEAVSTTRASSLYGVRAPSVAESISGVRASSTYAARVPSVAEAVSGTRASSVWGVRAPAIAKAVSGTRASSTYTALAAVPAYSSNAIPASGTYGVRAPTATIAVSDTRASSTWGVRAPAIAKAVSGTRASGLYGVPTPTVAIAASGTRASSAWGSRDSTLVSNVAQFSSDGLRASATFESYDATIEFSASATRATETFEVRPVQTTFTISAVRASTAWEAKNATLGNARQGAALRASRHWSVRRPTVTPTRPIMDAVTLTATLTPNSITATISE